MTAISDTPETDARRAGRDAGSLDKTPLEGMTDLARKLERERNEARARIEELERKELELSAALCDEAARIQVIADLQAALAGVRAGTHVIVRRDLIEWTLEQAAVDGRTGSSINQLWASALAASGEKP